MTALPLAISIIYSLAFSVAEIFLYLNVGVSHISELVYNIHANKFLDEVTKSRYAIYSNRK